MTSLVFAVVILALAIASMPIINLGELSYGQILSFNSTDTPAEPEQPSATIESFSISFENGTIAMLNDTTEISQNEGDYLTQVLNIVLSDAAEDELPHYSIVKMEDLLAEQELELTEAEELEEPQITEEDSSDSDDSDNGNGGGNEDDNGDDDPEAEPEPGPPNTGEDSSELMMICTAVISFGGGPCDEYPLPDCADEDKEANRYTGECE